MALNNYEVIIGLEVHAEIKTQSKLFCGCSAYAFGVEPNMNACPICMGFPGQLPVLNQVAFEKGILTALALNCEIPPFSKFDRKNYFYPDLPKGYQISQYDEPVSKNGWIDIVVDGKTKRIRINRLHLEDDAGKLTHVGGGTLCDYNRSGIGLMEIVTEPDFRASEEAVVYAKALQNILRFVGSSEADMEKGMMRFDASVSLRPIGEEKLYPRAEIKNLNSFRSLQSAIEYEVERQHALWESGNHQDKDYTVGWDEEAQKTYVMREKESSADYRYFPEPDLPPMTVEESFLSDLRAQIPELPQQKRLRYVAEFGLSEHDAALFTSTRGLSDYFEKVVAVSGDGKKSASFIGTVLTGRLNGEGKSIEESPVSASSMGELVKMIVDGTLSTNLAKGEVFEEMYVSGKEAEVIVEEKGLKQVSDTGALEEICKKVIAENEKIVADVKAGNERALSALMGPIMKETRGQANPKMVNDILKKLLA